MLTRVLIALQHWWCNHTHWHATSWQWDCPADKTDFHCGKCDRKWTAKGGPSA